MRQILVFFSLILSTITYAKGPTKTAPETPPPVPVDRFITKGTFAPGISVGFNDSGSLSFKYWYSEKIAFDVNIEYMGRPFTVAYADAHYHLTGLLAKAPGHLREGIVYVGAGVGAGAWVRDETCVRFHCTFQTGTSGSGDGYFFRTLLGLEWLIPKTRFSAFNEIVPSFLIYPNNITLLDFVLGARFYF